MKATLDKTHPDLSKEWHPTKNGNLTPDRVTFGSSKKVWWLCGVNPSHKWTATINMRRTYGTGCPMCKGKIPTSKTSLKALRPDIAEEWHPEKNGNLTPDDVRPGSGKVVWWRCSLDPSHEWQTRVSHRAKAGGSGCPKCAFRRVTPETALRAKRPDLLDEWHDEKNGHLTPDSLTPGSDTIVWWRCRAVPAHEWKAAVGSRSRGSGCPMCAGQRVTPETSLQVINSDLAKEWHPTKNQPLTPDEIMAGSSKKVWWVCRFDPRHEWKAIVANRNIGTGCPMCAGLAVSPTTSLRALYPDLANEWHPSKNKGITPDDVVAGSNKKYWWRCPEDGAHEWKSSVYYRAKRGYGCTICGSLQEVNPELSEEWEFERNYPLTPATARPGSTKKVWWRCRKDPSHQWSARIDHRANGIGCPACSGRIATKATSLRALHPKLVEEWHPIRNHEFTPDDVRPGSRKRAWWRCRIDPSHEWESAIYNRVNGYGCPRCNSGWTVSAIRTFVSSLKDHLPIFTPAELYLLFQQNGLLQTEGRSKSFVKALATGRFPLQEIEKFVNGDPSLVDQFIGDPDQKLESLERTARSENGLAGSSSSVSEMFSSEPTPINGDHDNVDVLIDSTKANQTHELPIIDTQAVLSALDRVISFVDEEAVEFLIASALSKIWKHAFRDETTAVVQAENAGGGEYVERVSGRFLDEYRRAMELPIPQHYAFQVDGNATLPNLMQRLIAVRLCDNKRVGNWSGTGAGKTLSAVLASRVVNAHLTVICCPNSVVDGWRDAILGTFPVSLVAAKTFHPDWGSMADDFSGFGAMSDCQDHRYLVLNYEAFQQSDSAERVRLFVESEQIDLIIVDEIHFAKQRTVENISQRRQLVSALTSAATERNPSLHVLGMSATPVINNLQEGKSMVELVTGVAHDELDTVPSVSNCMRLYQRLVTLGIRWMPEYALTYEQRDVDVDCGAYLDEIRALGQKGTPLALEQVLTRARLPTIRTNIRAKTVIYTHYVQGIDRLLRDAIEADGWKVGFYTGEDKSGLNSFIEGDLDVLIGSSAIGTGVDGLQQVCNRLIINVLPWTAAEFEQLKGRIYRQGQRQDSVTMVMPLTYAVVNGQRWSWCRSKMQRLQFKKSIADAAVDGVVPEGHLRTPAQAYQDLLAWLERLETGDVDAVSRAKVVVPLPDVDAAPMARRLRRYGDFSQMNRTWNQRRSAVTHERLHANPEEWAQYHTLYRDARKDWAIIPYEEIIRWCKQRSEYVIGDFGCGEAKLAEAVSDQHTVYSFDHVAINDNVIACDMVHVPLDDNTLDVAIFSLSLMGANFTSYIKEAQRTLKLDGQLHIIEATSRFTDRKNFTSNLESLGFEVVRVEDKWKFTHIRALKTERQPSASAELRF